MIKENRPMKKTTFLLWFALIVLMAGGCVSQQSQAPVTSPSSAPKIQIEALPRYVLGTDEVALDVQAVLTSLLQVLWGESEQIQGVRFDPRGDNRIRTADFLKEGFNLELIDISGFQMRESSDIQADAFIEGYFQFKDMIGRMVSFYYIAAYSNTPEGLSINASAALPLPSYSPVVETYFVPQAVFDPADLSDFSSFLDLYVYALANAVPMRSTKDAALSVESNPGDYYIMVFCMNWTAPESSLEMVITDRPGMKQKQLAEPVYLAWENWRVMIAGGNFNPHGKGPVFYTDIYYNLDPMSGTKPVLIGTFSNQKEVPDNRPKSLTLQIIERN